METTNPPDMTAPRRRVGRTKIILAAGAMAAAVALISCATVKRVVVAPPHIAGATYVGMDECSKCHVQRLNEFKGATHYWLKQLDGTRLGCEACHGPGSVHIETGAARDTIINPRKSPEICFQCHLDKRGEFLLAHSHPVIDGKVGCSDCHDPHKGDVVIGRGTALISQNDVCTQCHVAQRGPFIFEHEALREGCRTCHNPHGAVNNKMLVARNHNLCLSCHFQERRGGTVFIGGQDHGTRLARGACWSAGCHEAVHGSHVNSSLRF